MHQLDAFYAGENEKQKFPKVMLKKTLPRVVEAGPHHWHIEMQTRLYRGKSPIGKSGESVWKAGN